MLMNDSLLGPDPDYSDEAVGLYALEDVLGTEGYNELRMAIEAYPVVEEVANMAIQTSDGAVDGLGGPTEDRVPAAVSPGEFIFSADAAAVIGLDTLEAMHEEAKRLAASQY